MEVIFDKLNINIFGNYSIGEIKRGEFQESNLTTN